jgi:hypothetical protein
MHFGIWRAGIVWAAHGAGSLHSAEQRFRTPNRHCSFREPWQEPHNEILAALQESHGTVKKSKKRTAARGLFARLLLPVLWLLCFVQQYDARAPTSGF